MAAQPDGANAGNLDLLAASFTIKESPQGAMSLLKSVRLYLVALWSQWKVLLTGGSIIALVTIWALTTNAGLPYNIGWLILGITFITASFMSWRREHERAEQQARTIQEWEHNPAELPVSPQEQEKRTFVAAKIAGATEIELGVLKYLLNHDKEIRTQAVYRAVPGCNHLSIGKWRDTLIMERVEHDGGGKLREQILHATNDRFISIIPGLREALSYVLYSPANGPPT